MNQAIISLVVLDKLSLCPNGPLARLNSVIHFPRRFSVFLTVQGSKTVPHQVWGPRQVGLRPEGLKPGLRRSHLTSSEWFPGKCITESSLARGALGQRDNLSKTTKLILLDSLLQEVCIKTGSAGRSPLSSLRLSVCLVQSQTFFIQD